MKAKKILRRAATGWSPTLTFIVSMFILLTGLFLCAVSGFFLVQKTHGGIQQELQCIQPANVRP